MDAAGVAAALRESSGVRVVSGGTKLGWGRPIEAPELSVSELDAIVEHNEGDLTAILQAGVPLATAQAKFADAGQMLGFFAELGFIFPQFPYIAHSRGWSSEDMERNVEIVRASKELADGAAMLAKRCLDLADHLIKRDEAPTSIERGGRKAHAIES